MNSRFLPTALGLLVLGGGVYAQKYRWESNEGLRVKFQVHTKLKPVPMKLGQNDPHLRARFEPDNDGDYIYGRYGKFSWQLYLYEFDPTAAAKGAVTGKADKEPTKEEAEKIAAAEARSRFTAKNFREWVKIKDRSRAKRKFFKQGKKVKGGSKRPGHEVWEYSDGQSIRNSSGKQVELRWYKTAGVYMMGGRQIALLVVLPVKRGEKADKKYQTIAKRMLSSLRPLKADSGGSVTSGKADPRDKFAQSKRQKQELTRLKKNIGDLKNWDYFTTPNYIITYSWDKPRKRTKSKNFAKRISDRLEEIREKFVEYYPPHEKEVTSYSVIRVCADYNDFLKYGGVPAGVVGWFSPSSKELCVFYDTDKRFGDEDYIIGVCYHEAWHQYSDGYWPDRTLHRWFDEGLAEYFGSWRLRGRKWRIEYLKGRFQAIRRQINEETFIPSRDIVTWSKAKFYGPRAPDHYAQAYAMVDFLIRGKKKLGKRWDPVWSKVLDRYSKQAMAEKDQKKAVSVAFQGVDFEKFDAAWQAWVKSGNIKKM